MDRNIKIAKELVRIARALVADNEISKEQKKEIEKELEKKKIKSLKNLLKKAWKIWQKYFRLMQMN